jgi:hypothetical protein
MFQQIIDSGFDVLALINACHSGGFMTRLSFGPPPPFIPKNPGAYAITAGGSQELAWHSAAIGTGSIFFEKFYAALDGRVGHNGIVTAEEYSHI